MRGIQLRFVALVAGSLTVLLLFAGFHGFFVSRTALPEAVWSTFNQALIESTWRLFLVGFIYVVVVTLAAVFLSHRTVGPTERLEEEISEMAREEKPLEPLQIREGDEFAGLVEAINKLIERLLKKK